MSTPLHVVLVHGLWHGAWCWDAVVAGLADRGVAASAVELPMRALAEDAAVVRGVLDACDGPVLLVGHSYGGAVITVAGVHPAVTRLVYLAAFALDDGESIARVSPASEIEPTGLGAALRVSADNSQVGIDPDAALELLYHRTPRPVALAAVQRLRPVARSVFSERPAAIAWREVASTYVICSADRTVSPRLQQVMAARTTDTVVWDSDHSPLTSRPDDVVALLAELAAGQFRSG